VRLAAKATMPSDTRTERVPRIIPMTVRGVIKMVRMSEAKTRERKERVSRSVECPANLYASSLSLIFPSTSVLPDSESTKDGG